MKRLVRCLLGGGLLLLLITGPAHAEPELAPAGPCAEPRVALVPVPEFAIAGSARLHFDPREVSAALSPELTLPRVGLSDLPGVGRGSCDAPDAGCGAVLTTSAAGGPARPVESPAVPSLPPGAGGGRQ